MSKIAQKPGLDYLVLGAIAILITFSIVTLRSIAPSLFPLYFLYLFLALVLFFIVIQLDFEVISLFSKHFYIGSLLFLILPLIIGQVTRGAIRWIPIGPLTIQPAEIVRPLLLVFFANYLAREELTSPHLFKALLLLLVPTVLILIQPSLGVAVLTVVGFLGIIFAADIKKRHLILGLAGLLALMPLIWQILAPYQKQRIITFIDPSQDPLGTGYNALQSVISVGSGKLLGRGLGRGVQTQLAFLPERHTDFIFASIAEEMGFVGAIIVLLVTFFLFIRLSSVIENSATPAARAYVSGFFLTLLVQTFIHIGMNLGLLPITGVPYPLVSAGGSSLLATMLGLGIVLSAKKQISS
jgi:rod shape determining protein RodA